MAAPNFRGGDVKEVTLAVNTSIYADGDVLTTTVEIPLAVRELGGTGRIVSIGLLDEDDEGVAIDLFFLKTNVPLGTINAAISITDANAREILGIVSVLATGYNDLIGSQFAQVPATEFPIMIKAASDSFSIFVSAALRSGTPTFAAATDLSLKVGIEQD